MAASILFLGKRGDTFCADAIQLVRQHCPDISVYLASRLDPRPRDLDQWRGDYIISYLFPFVLSQKILSRAVRAAINFHPGPPEYPGAGCTNFALYEGAIDYGVTCHHMVEKVDSGSIIAVRRFPLQTDDTVISLTQRCYSHIFDLFREIAPFVFEGRQLPESKDSWTRRPFRRAELDELCRITPDMSANEAGRRIRAVTFPGAPGAYVELHGHRFDYASTVDQPKDFP